MRPALALATGLVALVATPGLPAVGASSARPGPRLASLPLVPMPSDLHERGGRCALSGDWTIVLEDSANDEVGARLLARDVEGRFHWRWALAANAPPGGRAVRVGRAPQGSEASPEGYALEILPGGITVSAPTPRGRFYALQTLRQIVAASPSGVLPCLVVHDRPAFPWRGVSLDISRGQIPTVRSFRRLVERLAYFKINHVALYMEDVLSDAPFDTAGLSPDELRLYVAAADRYHVRLTPIFQALGYTPSLTAALGGPKGARRLLGAGASRDPDFPLSDGARRLVERRIDLLAGIFHSPWFHVGGDELGTFGLANPGAAGVASDGSTHAAYARFLRRYLAARHGRRMMVYGDFVLRFPAVLSSLDRGTIVVDWDYQPDDAYATPRRFREAGFDSVIVSPGVWNWATFYPNFGRAFRNIAAVVDTGRAVGAVGTMISSWGDGGAESLEASNLPAFAYGAAASWEAATPPSGEFLARFARLEAPEDPAALAEALRLVGWCDLGPIDYAGRLFHRLPRVHRAGAAWRRRMEDLRRRAERGLALVAAVPRQGASAALLDDVGFAARRWRYVATRELAMDDIAAALESDPGPESQRLAARELEGLRADLAGIAREYRRRWLAASKPSGLGLNLRRLEGQMRELAAMRDAARHGALVPWKPGMRPLTASAVAG